MKEITFDNFCGILNVIKDKAIACRKNHQDFSYLGEHLTSRIDQHLIFAAISLSPIFDIKSIYEIGTCAGNCCRVLALMFPDAQIKTLDLPSNPDGTNAIRILSKFKNVTMENYDSKLLSFREKHSYYDCIFVDGCHENPEAVSDIAWGCRRVNQVIVFHDVGIGAPDVISSLKKLDNIISEEIFIIDSESKSANIGVIIVGHEKI